MRGGRNGGICKTEGGTELQDREAVDRTAVHDDTAAPLGPHHHPIDRGQQLPHSLNSPLLPVQRPSFGCARPLAAANLIAQGFHTYVARPDMCYGAPITGSGPAPGAGG